MANDIIVVLGSICGLLLSISLLWFASVRLIGRGVPFVNPESFVRYPQITPPDGCASASSTKPQKRILLQGVANFRDLGGYLTIDGRCVRWGLIYRSEALGRLTQRDLSYLSNLGLRLVCDLRTPLEITRAPDRVPHTARWIATPAQKGDFDTKMLPTLLFNRKIIPELMRQSYPKHLAENARYFGAILACFADSNNLPAVFHCTAGKDRAGLAAALLLGLLGVPDQTIVEDYSLSNLAFDQLFAVFVEDNKSSLRRIGVPLKELHPMFIADPTWMEGALAYINKSYGSITAYLIDAAGMDVAVLNRIRENLLE
jgi:protein-tyrosine phosphatase